jgi:pimeloyl-ACP methyl ester carboxylesterase
MAKNHTVLSSLRVQGSQPCLWRMVVLHGIMGRGRNFSTFARRVTSEIPSCEVLLADLRHHGNSTDFAGESTVQQVAQEVSLWLQSLAPMPWAFVGHSFGGKVALQTALGTGNYWPDLRQIWVLDASPFLVDIGSMAMLPNSPIRIVRLLTRLTFPVSDRADFVQQATNLGVEMATARWLAMNLREVDGGLALPFTPGEIELMLESSGRLSFEHELKSVSLDTYFIKAAQSPWIDQNSLAAINKLVQSNKHIHFYELQNAGHLVHNDNLEGLLRLMLPILRKIGG